jgi:hypothetical protein
LFDEFTDDVVKLLERFRMDAHVPVPVRHDIVTGAGLRLGGGGEFVLLTLPGDVVDPHLNVVLRAPLVT